MSSLASARFGSLLSEEREAALKADLGWLERLQGEKAVALEEMSQDPPAEDEREALALEARSNLVLLRQLSELHRALLLEHGAISATYGPNGIRSAPLASTTRRR